MDCSHQQFPAGDGLLSWFGHSNDNDTVMNDVTDSHEALTFGGMKQEFLKCPAFEPGTRVALIVDVAPVSVTAMLSLMSRNCAVCPFDPKLSVEQVTEAILQLQCNVLVTTKRLAEKFEPLFNQTILVTPSATTCGSITWSESPPPQQPPQHQCPDQVALILRTSGTTSKPKVVPLTLDNLYFNAKRLAQSIGLTKRDVCLSIMPVFHIGGIAANVFATIVSGSSTRFTPAPFDPEKFTSSWCNQATWVSGVPTLFKALLLMTSSCPKSQNTLRLIRTGAGHLNHEDGLELSERFNCPVMPSYSMSECMPICSTPWYGNNQLSTVKDSVGPAVGPSLRIIDPESDDSSPLPSYQVGEVAIKGRGVFHGYENSDGSEFTSDGWFRTGDLGLLNENGWVNLKGRKREMIKRGGEQVSLMEVEQIVCSHEFVDEAFAFGVEHPLWGEEVAVAVTLTENSVGVSATDVETALIDHSRKSLESFKVPTQVIMIQSVRELPMTATGKVRRSQIAIELQISPKELNPYVMQATSLASSRDTFSSPRAASKALYGLRFITSLWVVFFHMGNMGLVNDPNHTLMKLQNLSASMPVFMVLAGFLLTLNNHKSIKPSECIPFYVSRFSVIHPLYLLSIVLMIPPTILSSVSGPTLSQIFSNESLSALQYFVRLAYAFVVHISGFQYLFFPSMLTFNFVTWFISAYFILVMLFPMVDNRMRRCGTGVLVLVCVVLISISVVTWMTSVQPDFNGQSVWGLVWTSYVWLFFAAMALGHLFRRERHELKLLWGITTDLLSMVYVAVLVFVALDDCWYDPQTGTCRIVEEGYDYANATNRYYTKVGFYFGKLRVGQVLACMWVYALAHGEGLTAWALSNRIFVKYLAPQAIGIYLLQLPVFYYYYYIAHGVAFQPWMLVPAGPIPLPVEWYGLVVVITISAVICYFFNEYVNPRCIPYSAAFYSKFLFLGYGEEEDIKEAEGVFDKVAKVIRRLTGAVVEPNTVLSEVGIDSFGVTALCGSLKTVFSDAELTPAKLVQFETVENLVQFLDTDDNKAVETKAAATAEAPQETVTPHWEDGV